MGVLQNFFFSFNVSLKSLFLGKNDLVRKEVLVKSGKITQVNPGGSKMAGNENTLSVNFFTELRDVTRILPAQYWKLCPVL